MSTQTKPIKFLVATVSLLAMLFWSCPSPINSTGSSRLEDTTTPTILIVSPVEGATYSQIVTVSGTAKDNGSIVSITYAVQGVLGDLANGTVPLANLAEDGSFSFSFNAVSFAGPVSVEVKATDWNDNRATDTVLLAAPASAISSFSAISDSKSVELAWDAIPGATLYTVRWAPDGSVPSAAFGSSVTTTDPGYHVSGLENGRLYTFILSASTSSGTYWSSYEKCIPLSLFTLAPMVEGGYRTVELEWTAIVGTREFEVWRSDSQSGTYINLSGLISNTSFTDRTVVEGLTYYYKVRPALDGTPLSTWNSGSAQIIPDSGQRTTSIATPGLTGKVATYTGSGSWAYAAAGSSGVYIFNVSDPKAPFLTGTVATTDAKDVAVANGNLLVADGTSGFKVYSLAQPSTPAFLGVVEGLNVISISAVTSSNRAYLIDSTGSTRVCMVSFAVPTAPTLLASFFSAGFTFHDVAAISYNTSFDFVYATFNDSGDINKGKAIQLLATFSTSALSYYPTASLASSIYSYTDYNFIELTVSGAYVYALGDYFMALEPPPPYSLFILNRFPTNPGLKGKTSTDQHGNVADLRHDPATGRLYVVDGIGVKSFDVSTPASITLDESINTPGSPTGIAILGDFAMIGTGVRSFQTFDLRSPVALTQKPGYNAGSGRTGIVTRGFRAYTAGNGLLEILSIVDPEVTLPSLGQVAVPGAVDLAVSGDYAFIAAGSNGLTVVDLTSESAPSIVGSALPAAGTLAAVAVKGDYAYCAGSGSLEIFDISNPGNPVWKGFIDSEGMGMHDVAIRGSRVYVTDGSYFQPNSLKIVDITDPAQPLLLARTVTGGTTLGPVRVTNKYAFVGDILGSGVWAVDIDPNSGFYLKAYGPADTDPANSSNTKGISLSGAYVFATDSTSGFAVLDASNPPTWDHAEPNTGFIAKTLNIGGHGGELSIQGRYAYITDSTFGLRVVRLF